MCLLLKKQHMLALSKNTTVNFKKQYIFLIFRSEQTGSRN